MSASPEDADIIEEDEMEDLFGDGGDDDAISDNERALSDNDLASDKGEERYGYDDEDGTQQQDVKTKVVQAVQMFRHRTPRSIDVSLRVKSYEWATTDIRKQLQSLKIPKFIKVIPEPYNEDTYEPTQWEIDNDRSSNPKPVIRFRKHPETGELQSNAVFVEWEDGSSTLAIGDDHYDLQAKELAPASNKPYSEHKDTHYYVAAAHLASNALLTVGHVVRRYEVRVNENQEDEAVERLKAKMAAANSSRAVGVEMIITTTQDPELQKKQAELAEKERARAQRRRENATARQLDGARGGYSRGALSIGDLEGGRRAPGSRKKGGASGPRPKRRRPEYDSDDDLPQGAHRQDEYDVEDDFIAPSDEEEEPEDEEEEEDLLDDEDEDDRPRTKRQKTAEGDDADADADGDLDDDAGGPTTSHRDHPRRPHHRQIIDEDEED